MLQWLQDAWISALIRESTWGYPIVGAIHVLGLAWFGGSLLVKELGALRRIGFAFMLATGAILFASQPVRYYESTSFRIKMALIVLVCIHGLRRPGRVGAAVSLSLWIAIIVASRGIAFF